MWTFSLSSQLEISPEKLFFRVRHREFTFQWACGIELRLHAISLLCFFVTSFSHVNWFCLSPFSLKKCLVHLHLRLRVHNLLQIQRRKWTRELTWKAVARNRRIRWIRGAGSDLRRSCRVSWAAYFWRGGIADFTKSFFWGGRHRRLVCVPCYEIQNLSQYKSRE